MGFVPNGDKVTVIRSEGEFLRVLWEHDDTLVDGFALATNLVASAPAALVVSPAAPAAPGPAVPAALAAPAATAAPTGSRAVCKSGDACLGTADSLLFRLSGSFKGVFCDNCARVLESHRPIQMVALASQPEEEVTTKPIVLKVHRRAKAG